MSRRGIDLTGQRFGRLLVENEAVRGDGIVWRCLCDCGGLHLARTGHLRAGVVTSCGCAQRDAGRRTGLVHGHKRRKHGMSRSRLDGIFDNMMKRCYRPGSRRYERYGGRGIGIFNQWIVDRASFFAWAMANGYSDGLSIERVDNDGNYEPGNCRWIERGRQQANTSRSHMITWDGRSQTLSDWAREIGIAPRALQRRADRGWPIDRILTQPLRVRG